MCPTPRQARRNKQIGWTLVAVPDRAHKFVQHNPARIALDSVVSINTTIVHEREPVHHQPGPIFLQADAWPSDHNQRKLQMASSLIKFLISKPFFVPDWQTMRTLPCHSFQEKAQTQLRSKKKCQSQRITRLRTQNVWKIFSKSSFRFTSVQSRITSFTSSGRSTHPLSRKFYNIEPQTQTNNKMPLGWMRKSRIICWKELSRRANCIYWERHWDTGATGTHYVITVSLKSPSICSRPGQRQLPSSTSRILLPTRGKRRIQFSKKLYRMCTQRQPQKT